MKRISIIVPFLNERENLPILIQRLENAFSKEPEEWEIIFIDDGSSDGSSEWLLKNINNYKSKIRLIQLSRNFGHQIAISAGIDHAEADAIIIMDADLQDPPEVIPEMLKKWREGAEVVYAVRRSRSGESWLKRTLASLFYRIFHKLTSIEVPRDAGDFRLLDRSAALALRTLKETHRYMRGLTSWVGFRQCAIYYDRAPRLAGTTKYPIWKSMKLAWDGLTSFTGAPLRWVSSIGFVACLAGVIWGIQVIYGKIMHPATPERGWTSIMAAMLFLGGIQLLSLGLLGQYMSRTFEEAKKRPLYFIRFDSQKNQTQL
jgi:glycosyltransferase involved in cell wall biosynthesis